MVEEQTQPQFIFWVAKERLFRPAELKIPENAGGYDLEKNIELGKREISPESLNLVSSVYLGPVNISGEDTGQFINKTYDVLIQLNPVRRLVRLAEDLAERRGVPYFAVDVVRTPKDRTWEFMQKRLLEELYSKKQPIGAKKQDFPIKKDKKDLLIFEKPRHPYPDKYISVFEKPRHPYPDKYISAETDEYISEKSREFVLHPTAQLYVPRE